jgi:ABC-2 type transport system ATP-binding protein
MAAIIDVQHVHKQFKEVKAVDDLSFTVNEGDVYGFLGQNGAGKSTTIRMLLSLVRPTSGSLRLFGKDIGTHKKEILRQVGAVIERPDLYKYLSGHENLSLFARISGVKVSAKRIQEQLEMVGLSARAHSKVKTYSQGMKQRLGLAVALVHDPQLIILDEPTNGLDPQGIADMRNMILHLSRDLKKTVVVSSHLLYEIEQVANRMIIIDKGKKIVEGVVQELFDPASMLVELQTEDNGKALAVLAGSEWSNRLKEERAGKLLFSMSREEVPAFNTALVQMGIGVTELRPMHSLEDYFLSLTGK